LPMQAIIDRLDAQFADPGYRYALLRREDWQTLKTAVLAQQANNTGSPKLPPCNWCDGWSERSQFGHYLYCPECGRQLRAGA